MLSSHHFLCLPLRLPPGLTYWKYCQWHKNSHITSTSKMKLTLFRSKLRWSNTYTEWERGRERKKSMDTSVYIHRFSHLHCVFGQLGNETHHRNSVWNCSETETVPTLAHRSETVLKLNQSSETKVKLVLSSGTVLKISSETAPKCKLYWNRTETDTQFWNKTETGLKLTHTPEIKLKLTHTSETILKLSSENSAEIKTVLKQYWNSALKQHWN